ncbi:hypothetical protein AOE01nite_33140 [Acetobacter oeni]|uniref:Uncharacterized protein n=1 Tax=Acetobacter oeni TaxID=304077 RepID=A0A511XQ51_9PROT|nr:hypothetical protein AA21952_2471 [Acetobacter oeni LMG 21952]GEN65090.1 hypothetical protein AOE01nite_33140 [Acetobacter oeni]
MPSLSRPALVAGRALARLLWGWRAESGRADKGAELHPGLLKTTQPHSFGTEREGETVTRFWTSREGAAV